MSLEILGMIFLQMYYSYILLLMQFPIHQHHQLKYLHNHRMEMCNVKRLNANDDVLHIHIRSDDNFINPVNSWYMQPPLDFYINETNIT